MMVHIMNYTEKKWIDGYLVNAFFSYNICPKSYENIYLIKVLYVKTTRDTKLKLELSKSLKFYTNMVF